jgi:hypothetical protein
MGSADARLARSLLAHTASFTQSHRPSEPFRTSAEPICIGDFVPWRSLVSNSFQTREALTAKPPRRRMHGLRRCTHDSISARPYRKPTRNLTDRVSPAEHPRSPSALATSCLGGHSSRTSTRSAQHARREGLTAKPPRRRMHGLRRCTLGSLSARAVRRASRNRMPEVSPGQSHPFFEHSGGQAGECNLRCRSTTQPLSNSVCSLTASAHVRASRRRADLEGGRSPA